MAQAPGPLRGLALAGALALSQAATGAPVQMELPHLDRTRFIKLADYENRPMVLNFWSSECPHCLQELPSLFVLAQRHPQYQFLGIAADQRHAAQRVLAGLRPTFPQLLAPPPQSAQLLRRLGNAAGVLPFTLVLDPRHEACARHVGEPSAAWLGAALRRCAEPTRQGLAGP